MRSRTKSVDDPPACRPILAPPIEYIAGADHLPLNWFPYRQSKGPRPPLPPTPKPNFFTSGRMSTQSALERASCEMSLLLSISCNKRLAFESVSSSFCLSAANNGRIKSRDKKQRNALPIIRTPVFSDAVPSMSFLLSLGQVAEFRENE